MQRAVSKNIKSMLVLCGICIYLVCILSHTLQNLLSYDAYHSLDMDYHVLQIDEQAQAADTEEKPTWKVVVNLDEYKVYVYKEDALLKTYPCSGGKKETPSPTGDFKIVSKEARGENMGGVWLGLNVPWGTFGIHGTKFPWVIGQYHASNGCIRLFNKDAKELTKLIPIGTPVRIIQKNRPFRKLACGDTGSDVRDIEIALATLGFYEGTADGKFGKQLYASIVRFQKISGLIQTGIVDKTTYDRINKQFKQLLY